MNLQDFGLLLRTLRQGSYDPGGRRWTRENLSRAVHLSEDQLGRLERGDRKYLDNQTLHQLARAFCLSRREEKEFFWAAFGLPDETFFRNEDPLLQLKNLIAVMESLHAPAYIIDCYGDIVAVNSSLLKLYGLSTDIISHTRKIPAGQNLVYVYYSPLLNLKNQMGTSWKKSASMAIMIFRRITLRYRHTAYYHYIFESLLKENQFDIDWYSSHRGIDQYDLTYEPFELGNAEFGTLSYLSTETIVNTRAGDLYLIINSPTDVKTSDIFRELIGPDNNRVYKVASWPDKKMV